MLKMTNVAQSGELMCSDLDGWVSVNCPKGCKLAKNHS